ncbi:DUF2911 domain-containing protein [Maribacter sp. HTCC2170]|uniref:DUF2911 domain-containing protein n=1 Tax=Maribacter sp. (strain HTCC2170 / KCCM 42371) TaxID=313603 RepID=UPI00006B2120|nr:DUF2911 domain-containing protein [Maribacter sp. HTCC2170]EAR00141.1 hypothetical protein FB2170_00705 [Maribacter sp. HTCC2170]
MKKLKWILLVLIAIIALIMFVGWPYMKEQTKKHSPQVTNTYNKNGLDLSINYSSPSKKDRVIFGDLVPYDVVWRTGANEPTTFTTATNIKIIDKSLPAGTYSFWTKPGKESWEVMFNSEIDDWGVTILSGGKETTRNPDTDVVNIKVPSNINSNTQERLTIDFEDGEQLHLTLSWDQTSIKIPITK